MSWNERAPSSYLSCVTFSCSADAILRLECDAVQSGRNFHNFGGKFRHPLLFEEGGSAFPRNVGKFIADCMVSCRKAVVFLLTWHWSTRVLRARQLLTLWRLYPLYGLRIGLPDVPNCALRNLVRQGTFQFQK